METRVAKRGIHCVFLHPVKERFLGNDMSDASTKLTLCRQCHKGAPSFPESRGKFDLIRLPAVSVEEFPFDGLPRKLQKQSPFLFGQSVLFHGPSLLPEPFPGEKRMLYDSPKLHAVNEKPDAESLTTLNIPIHSSSYR
jgi:hypothetical protein